MGPTRSDEVELYCYVGLLLFLDSASGGGGYGYVFIYIVAHGSLVSVAEGSHMGLVK